MSVFYVKVAGYNTGTPNFGWSLGNTAATSMPMPPAPHYNPQTHQYDGEPGVEEEFSSKNAGSMSFAHYIVNHQVSLS